MGTTNDTAAARRASAERIRAIYQWIHIIVDFSAGLLFVVGSAMFFYPDWVEAATWCFLIGSIFFAGKPTIRLVGHLHLKRLVDGIEHGLEQVVREL